MEEPSTASGADVHFRSESRLWRTIRSWFCDVFRKADCRLPSSLRSDGPQCPKSAKSEAVDRRLLTLQREVVDADERLNRLYRSIEDGIVELDDIVRDRTATLKRERAKAALDRARAQCGTAVAIDPEKIDAFSQLMIDNLDNGDVNARKGYIRAIVGAIRFDAVIRIGILRDSSLIARRIAPVRSVRVASPDYLARNGRPRCARWAPIVIICSYFIRIFANLRASVRLCIPSRRAASEILKSVAARTS